MILFCEILQQDIEIADDDIDWNVGAQQRVYREELEAAQIAASIVFYQS